MRPGRHSVTLVGPRRRQGRERLQGDHHPRGRRGGRGRRSRPGHATPPARGWRIESIERYDGVSVRIGRARARAFRDASSASPARPRHGAGRPGASRTARTGTPGPAADGGSGGGRPRHRRGEPRAKLSVLWPPSSRSAARPASARRDPVGVVGRKPSSAKGSSASPASTVSGPAVCDTAVTPHAARPRISALVLNAARRRGRSSRRRAPPRPRRRAREQAARSSGENGSSKIQCPRSGPRAPRRTCTARRPPSRLARKWMSSKQVSEPSSSDGSTAPHTVSRGSPPTPRALERRHVRPVRDLAGEPRVAGLVAGDVQHLRPGEAPRARPAPRPRASRRARARRSRSPAGRRCPSR